MKARTIHPLHRVTPGLILLTALATPACSGEAGSFDNAQAETPSQEESETTEDLREVTEALNNATDALNEAAEALKDAADAQATASASPDTEAQQLPPTDPAMDTETASDDPAAPADSPEQTTSNSMTREDSTDPSEQDTVMEAEQDAVAEAEQDSTTEADAPMPDTTSADGSTPIDPSLDTPEPTIDPLLAEAICTSGQFSTADENDRMRPGEACVACHTEEREGPRYTIAGTLYPTGHEPNNCNGVSDDSGAVIVITDANGQEFQLDVNSSGNFTSRESIATPYKAKVVTALGERPMLTPQTDGDCNSCHTPEGEQAAPGRITLPFQ